LPLPNAKGNADERAASASSTAGATPMARFKRMSEGGELVAKKHNTEVQDREAEVHSRNEAVS
jgi:hypothetical protein